MSFPSPPLTSSAPSLAASAANESAPPPSENPVVPRARLDVVGVVAAEHRVVARVAVHRVDADSAGHRVPPGPAGQEVLHRPARQDVVSAAAVAGCCYPRSRRPFHSRRRAKSGRSRRSRESPRVDVRRGHVDVEVDAHVQVARPQGERLARGAAAHHDGVRAGAEVHDELDLRDASHSFVLPGANAPAPRSMMKFCCPASPFT